MAPPRTRVLASRLLEALRAEVGEKSEAAATLNDRVITDGFLRGEADRDQNVYLGALFTRVLTRAVPDVIFQPISLGEAARALRWAREARVPVTLRGAASTAMGGAVPNDGGLTLDLSRLDQIDLDAEDAVAVVGAGARLRTIHQRLAQEGLALKVYPSNLGGTLVGWFVTGGIGMNAWGHGRALDCVRAADVVLPAGEHVRFHDDGRLDVPDEGPRRKTLPAAESEAWFTAHGYRPMALADLAGSEGVLGLVLRLAVAVERRREIGAFLLAFGGREAALEAAAWVARESGSGFGAPANLKLLSASHLHHIRKVWEDDDAREWRARPGKLSSGADLPWTRIVGPAELGAATGGVAEGSHGAYLFVDFLDLEAARAFAGALAGCPGSPGVSDGESLRFAADRFRPMQTKRLGPGLLAAEIVMPAAEVPRFLPAAGRLARGMGSDLDAEVYYLADGSALVIAAYLVDHRSGAFAVELMLAPALLDLAMARHQGRPYVLGRWQSPWMSRRFEAPRAARLRGIKRSLDPAGIVGRGVLFGLQLRGALGALTAASFKPGVRMVRVAGGSPALSGLVRAARGALAGFRGPAHGRGERAVIGARFPAGAAEPAVAPAATPQAAAARALHCVNCGECNTVCPIFHAAKIRLPQMLTHLGEAMHAGEPIGGTGIKLLDLCMRCGNCEEVCQAGIPHLPLYEAMQGVSERAESMAPTQEARRERHLAILGTLRGSTSYTRGFLDIRPGAYLRRTPASLPGVNRFLLLRAENDAGPAATCIHCGACVAVCPTGANHEYQGEDPRTITTDQERCIGCGTCVEVCPANHLNGGQTLRVMEAPTRDWFVALDELDRAGRT